MPKSAHPGGPGTGEWDSWRGGDVGALDSLVPFSLLFPCAFKVFMKRNFVQHFLDCIGKIS